MNTAYADCYWGYLKRACPELDSESLSRVASILETTSWDEPTSAIDLNNVAVVALLEAENCLDLSCRQIYLEIALEALNKAVELYNHPLCAAHLAIVLAMTGEVQRSLPIAFSAFVNTLQSAYAKAEKTSPGIVYLPSHRSHFKNPHAEQIIQILQSENGYTQSLLLLSEALCQTQMIFYNASGLRLLNLAAQMFPNSSFINLKLGISSICNNQWEGLLYLQLAKNLAPDYAPILQALYIAYKDLGQMENANLWLTIARELRPQHPGDVQWQWSELELNSLLTYVPFQNELLLTVEPSFRSIVTSVLIAEGDWFEKEMEFWRSWLQPGMTVIDVGANVGVYTFSAALKVGSEGRVLAIEPFSGCVRCLQETCKINQLSWVKVCAGAASDREGTARLSLSTASELNAILTDDSAEMDRGSFEEVSCFSLDSLIDNENLTQVDFLKIDAEGHEMSVLMGSDRLLSQFSPVILYENIAGSQGSNLPVADYLRSRGYQLFCYQPYVKELISLEDNANLQNNLNIIAWPCNKSHAIRE